MNTITKYITALAMSLIMTAVCAQQQNHSNLWKIEGNGIKTSYVFGTMHIIPQNKFKLKDKVKEAFEASEQIVLEIDMADPKFTQDVMANSYLENGKQLKSFMDDSEYELLDKYLKEKTGTGMTAYNNAKPLLLMSVILMVSSDEPMASFEMTLMKMAKASKKEIEGLETYASQVAVFDSESYETQIDDLIEMIANPEETKNIYSKMAELYTAEDIETLYDYMDVFMDHDVAMMKKLLDDRNHEWIPKITKFSKAHSVFYGVGAGHLGGDQGVINLLKKAGYTVTPVFD